MARPEVLHAGQKGTKLTNVIREEATRSMDDVLQTLRKRGRKIYLRNLSDRPQLTKCLTKGLTKG